MLSGPGLDVGLVGKGGDRLLLVVLVDMKVLLFQVSNVASFFVRGDNVHQHQGTFRLDNGRRGLHGRGVRSLVDHPRARRGRLGCSLAQSAQSN